MVNALPRFVATVSDAQIRGWRRAGYTVETIASATGMTTSQVLRRMQQLYSVPRAADPDQRTIRRLCAEIQRGWSDEEREKRLVGKGGRWTPTVVPASVVASAQNWPGGCDGPHESTPTYAPS